MSATSIDPVCVFHGKRRSEHVCLVCCICFKDLSPDECWADAEGQKWDLCAVCGESEAAAVSAGTDPP